MIVHVYISSFGFLSPISVLGINLGILPISVLVRPMGLLQLPPTSIRGVAIGEGYEVFVLSDFSC